jgi:hypothetical protein
VRQSEAKLRKEKLADRILSEEIMETNADRTSCKTKQEQFAKQLSRVLCSASWGCSRLPLFVGFGDSVKLTLAKGQSDF